MRRNAVASVTRPLRKSMCVTVSHPIFLVWIWQPRILSMMFSHPGFYTVVAELQGRIVGSNCLDERTPIAGVGPVTVDPGVQNQAIGRRLMQAVLDRAAEKRFAGVRLLQAAFHNRSLSLYAKLGFDVREFLSVMQGPPINKPLDGYRVRAAVNSDQEDCIRLCRSVHGHDRGGELIDAIKGRHRGYCGARRSYRRLCDGNRFPGARGGETNPDLQALIASASAFLGPESSSRPAMPSYSVGACGGLESGRADDANDRRPL